MRCAACDLTEPAGKKIEAEPDAEMAARKRSPADLFKTARYKVAAAPRRQPFKRGGREASGYRQDNDPAIRTQLTTNMMLAGDLNTGGTPAMVIGGKLSPGAMELAELRAATQEARTR